MLACSCCAVGDIKKIDAHTHRETIALLTRARAHTQEIAKTNTQASKQNISEVANSFVILIIFERAV